MVVEYEDHLKRSGDTDLLAEFMSQAEREKFAFVHATFTEDRGWLQRYIKQVAGPDEHSSNYGADVERNKVTEKREQAFYVDFRNGKLAPTPFDITFDEASQWIERAEFATFLAESHLRDRLRTHR